MSESIYPNAIDGYKQIPLVVDQVTRVDAISVNSLRCAIINIEEELGVEPSGTYDTVRARLDDLKDLVGDFDDLSDLINAHIDDEDNPHNTSFSTLVGGTLAELNTLIVDANLSENPAPGAHAASHVEGGSDEIDADILSVTFTPINYTRNTAPVQVTSLTELTAHLRGIDDGFGLSVSGPGSSTDNAVARFNGTTGKIIQNSLVSIDDSGNITLPGTVDGRNVSADGLALDGHVVNTSNPHLTDIGNLGSGTLAELNSIITDATLDDSSSPRSPTSHASSHISGGSDEIDGDQIDISFSPINYSIDNDILLEHLSGIDDVLGVNQEDLDEAAAGLNSRLDEIIFHLEIITGFNVSKSNSSFDRLDDIILLFSLISDAK